MEVKIDKSWREIISNKIDSFVSACAGLLANGRDFSFFYNDFEAISNSIRKNQTGICEDPHNPAASHFLIVSWIRRVIFSFTLVK